MLLTVNQSFSPYCLGLEFGTGIRVQSHVRVDGWENAWLVPTTGVVVLFNLCELIELAGIITVGVLL